MNDPDKSSQDDDPYRQPSRRLKREDLPAALQATATVCECAAQVLSWTGRPQEAQALPTAALALRIFAPLATKHAGR